MFFKLGVLKSLEIFKGKHCIKNLLKKKTQKEIPTQVFFYKTPSVLASCFSSSFAPLIRPQSMINFFFRLENLDAIFFLTMSQKSYEDLHDGAFCENS